MSKFLQGQVAFNSGEWSEKLWNRLDLDKFQQSTRILENMLIQPYGGIHRRVGTECICAANDQDPERPPCLVSFEVGAESQYVLEFSEENIRVFQSGSCDSCPQGEINIATPYAHEDLKELQFARLNDVMFITHPDHPLMRLERRGDCDWALVECEFTQPPLCEENTEEAHTITTDVDAQTVGDVGTMTASEDTWSPEHVGAYYEICCQREPGEYEVTIPILPNEVSAELIVDGAWDVSTFGLWAATICVEKFDEDTQTWVGVYQGDGKKDRQLSFGGVSECRERYRVLIKDFIDIDGSGNQVTLSASGTKICGLVQIQSYVSPTEVTYEVIKPLDEAKATSLWSEGAWSLSKGYPKAITFHEERLVLGGTKYSPQTIWGSAVDDFKNFSLGTEDDDAYEYTIAASESNAIQWLISQQQLLAGTTQEEWAFGSGQPGQIITSSNIEARRQSTYGSDCRQATMVNDSVFYTQRGKRKIRQERYSIDRDGYVSDDLTVYSEHVTRGGVKDDAYQQNRDAIYWVVNGCGELAGMTYEQQQGVAGWHRHTTQGKFESVATIYGDSVECPEEDEVWFSVLRECNGKMTRFIERFRPEHYRVVDECKSDDYWFLDCGRKVTSEDGEPITQVTGLEDFEGCELSVFADGACRASATVVGGVIDLQEPAERCVLVGFPYESRVQSRGLELQLRNGTSIGREKKVCGVNLTMWKSYGGEVGGHIDFEEKHTCGTQKGRNDDEWQPICCEEEEMILGEAPKAWSGPVCLDVPGNRTKDGVVSFRQTQPFPFGITSMAIKFEVTGCES